MQGIYERLAKEWRTIVLQLESDQNNASSIGGSEPHN